MAVAVAAASLSGRIIRRGGFGSCCGFCTISQDKATDWEIGLIQLEREDWDEIKVWQGIASTSPMYGLILFLWLLWKRRACHPFKGKNPPQKPSRWIEDEKQLQYECPAWIRLRPDCTLWYSRWCKYHSQDLIILTANRRGSSWKSLENVSTTCNTYCDRDKRGHRWGRVSFRSFCSQINEVKGRRSFKPDLMDSSQNTFFWGICHFFMWKLNT